MERGIPADHLGGRPRHRAAARLADVPARSGSGPRAPGWCARASPGWGASAGSTRGTRTPTAHPVRLLALRGPPLPDDPGDGRRRACPATRSPSPRSPSRRCARAATTRPPAWPTWTTAGHRGLAQLPDLPSLRRPGLLRGPRQGARLRLHPGLQRLDGGGVVRRPPAGAASCLVPFWDPALAAGEVRAQRRRGGAGHHLLRDPRLPRLALHPRQGPLLGPAVRRLRRDRHRRVHAHRLGLEDAVDLGRRPAGGAVHRHLHQLHALDCATGCSRACSSASRPSRSPTARARSAGSPTSSSGPTTSGRPTGPGEGWPTWCPSRPRTYFARQIFGCFFSDRFGLGNLADIGEDNVMFECDYPHSDSTWPDTLEVAGR